MLSVYISAPPMLTSLIVGHGHDMTLVCYEKFSTSFRKLPFSTRFLNCAQNLTSQSSVRPCLIFDLAALQICLFIIDFCCFPRLQVKEITIYSMRCSSDCRRMRKKSTRWRTLKIMHTWIRWSNIQVPQSSRESLLLFFWLLPNGMNTFFKLKLIWSGRKVDWNYAGDENKTTWRAKSRCRVRSEKTYSLGVSSANFINLSLITFQSFSR